ncbi:SDR family oxidoreductase [Vibrio proteolyticus]|uniref:Putative oxidoreductase n=1 Tax=Vibrio proteolyticus NBRC 13287 TaxID=1219065 RepID=U3BBC0_VIBPR|nr:SDR family oxidoreductase [Vibrio proteolyticus]GAD67094.1 putative oxidoreductase [Vibrio proteolyticus NBRC 13287]
MEILIVGGNGGIGRALVKEALSRFSGANVHATYRRECPEMVAANLIWHRMDVENESSIEQVALSMTRLDWIINTVGLLHCDGQMPEKNSQSVEAGFFMHNMMVNALPTLLLAKHFRPLLKGSRQPLLAALSARVGSISDNRLGGWYSYRASKAALNMIIKTLALEWSRTLPASVVVTLHPGTTDTPLSAPFQSKVAPDKLFTPERVARDLLTVLSSLKATDSGRFLAYDGSELPW